MMLNVLFATLWQGAVILAAAAIIARCIPKRNAATHYAVWYIALLALVGVPLATAFSHFGADLLRLVAPAATAHAHISFLLTPLQDAQSGSVHPDTGWILALWAAGACLQFIQLAVSFVRIAKIKRNSYAFSNAQRDVRVSGELAIPIAAGVLEPCVILPRALLDTLSGEDLDRIIEHERAHIRRRDVAANCLQRCIDAMLYFNPWARIISRQVTNAREAACDDLAVHATRDEHSYAMCLARLIGIAGEHTPLATPSAIGSHHTLVDRIERLLNAGPPMQITPNYYTIGGTVIIFAALTLALQALSPAAPASPATQSSLPTLNNLVAASASCKTPNAEATVIDPARPRFPESAKNVGGWAVIRVTVTPHGNVSEAVIDKSSGNATINLAAADAAAHSTFSPKIVNCKPVPGTYLFKVNVQAH